MPTIEFEVAPENQQAFIDGIADEVERHFKSYVGFVSASFHASENGRRVINYAQWRSKEDWAASGRLNGATKQQWLFLKYLNATEPRRRSRKSIFFVSHG